jgi:hypothetical protein
LTVTFAVSRSNNSRDSLSHQSATATEFASCNTTPSTLLCCICYRFQFPLFLFAHHQIATSDRNQDQQHSLESPNAITADRISRKISKAAEAAAPPMVSQHDRQSIASQSQEQPNILAAKRKHDGESADPSSKKLRRGGAKHGDEPTSPADK